MSPKECPFLKCVESCWMWSKEGCLIDINRNKQIHAKVSEAMHINRSAETEEYI